MAYTLNYSGGTITVNDGALNTNSTSLSLPGRNYAGYGQPVDQNLVSMLENFASTAAPANPLRGQIWFDTGTSLLKYNSGTSGPVWTTLASVGADATFTNLTATGNATVGNLYANTGTIQGNYIVSLTNHVFATAIGLAAAGNNQSSALGLTKDINVINSITPGLDDGVRLPSTTGGLRITIINQNSINTLKVYPATGAQINALGTNLSYSLAPGARLDFLSVSSTQWYTLNATYS